MIKKLYLILFVFFVSHLYGIETDESDKINFLQTDRFCYVSGDLVLLKAYYSQSCDEAGIKESVLYIDIVNRDSQFISGEIFKLNDGFASGFVRIPDTVKTGYYLLRAYTYNSIQNAEQKILTYQRLYITNRFGNNSEHFEGDSNLLGGLISETPFKEVPDANCEISLSDTLFKRRSKVSATIQLHDDLSIDTLWAAFAVKPVTQCEGQMMAVNNFLGKNNTFEINPNKQNSKYSEKKGMIISGHVNHSITGNPLSNILILLALEDSIIRLKYSISDKSGEFKFVLTDCYEKQVIYLSAYSYPDLHIYSQANLSLNSKFLDKGSALIEQKKAVNFEKSMDSLNVIKSIIAKAYDINYLETLKNPNRGETSFEHSFIAGNFTNTVMIDDYIDLPDFIQITREILPFVRLRKEDNKYVFSVIDGENSVIRENPIVFVDGVPLTDINTILTWGTDKIKMVQVQTEPRYFGDVPFENGMVFIWTKKMNFWSEIENKGTQIFTIPCFQKPIKFNFPNYSKDVSLTHPDFRQILYWEPSVVIDSKGAVQFDFYTSDEVGTYELVLHGATHSKKSIFIRKYFQVK